MHEHWTRRDKGLLASYGIVQKKMYDPSCRYKPVGRVWHYGINFLVFTSHTSSSTVSPHMLLLTSQFSHIPSTSQQALLPFMSCRTDGKQRSSSQSSVLPTTSRAVAAAAAAAAAAPAPALLSLHHLILRHHSSLASPATHFARHPRHPL
ncbi:hypothetical protein Pcinc_029937 [Petrolisthes cinctipes]|uniref:Uncharacterized protein n=1 Tax=Petrolisthes cinctipes TaxID=88211 RepID=A0AAE1EZB0_PETCI|nr:hypothetical protein Pcinc_029937 [Petrolisthes cinctipes]